MQHRLRSASPLDQETDSDFDAIREMLSKEAAERLEHDTVPPLPRRPQKPLSPGLSHPSLGPAQRPQFAQRAGAVSGVRTPPVLPREAYPELRKLRKSAARRSRPGAIRQWLKIAAILGASGLAILFPGVVLAAVVLVTGGMTAAFLTLGPDAFWQRALRPVRRYVARHPDRAGTVHARMERIADRMDRVLDVFPEQWVSGLYLPDLADIAAVADQDDAPIDLRMESLAGG